MFLLKSDIFCSVTLLRPALETQRGTIYRAPVHVADRYLETPVSYFSFRYETPLA